MKKLIPLFLAAILLLCNIFAGNALAANETAPETLSIPTSTIDPKTDKRNKIYGGDASLIDKPTIINQN